MALLLEVEQYEKKIDTGVPIKQKDLQIAKPLKSGQVNITDERIQRIKLVSLAYFIADDEISFYGLHWDFQIYRRSRRLGFTGYPRKPEPKPKKRCKKEQKLTKKPEDKQYLQPIVGSLLSYARAVNPTILHAVNNIASQQNRVSTDILKATKHLLNASEICSIVITSALNPDRFVCDAVQIGQEYSLEMARSSS